jgi:hypothetical protein
VSFRRVDEETLRAIAPVEWSPVELQTRLQRAAGRPEVFLEGLDEKASLFEWPLPGQEYHWAESCWDKDTAYGVEWLDLLLKKLYDVYKQQTKKASVIDFDAFYQQCLHLESLKWALERKQNSKTVWDDVAGTLVRLRLLGLELVN